MSTKESSDGSTASYYELPVGATELQHLISYKNMNAQMGEIFRENYRYGEAEHCDKMRGIKKILFYAEAEKERLENVRELIEEDLKLLRKIDNTREAVDLKPGAFGNWGCYELPIHTIEGFLRSDAEDDAVISFSKGELRDAISKEVTKEIEIIWKDK